MSVDAKAFPSDTNDWIWTAVHDGPCSWSLFDNKHHGYLVEILVEVEKCMGQSMRWEIRTYPDGKIGLVGKTT